MIERGSSKGSLAPRDRISICRVTFDEHRSIVREPRTKPQRTGIEAPTNRGRSQPHCRNHVDARACAWIGADAKTYPYGPSKKLLSEARRLGLARMTATIRPLVDGYFASRP